MSVTTSDKAVTAYLDNLLNDISLDLPLDEADVQVSSPISAPTGEYHPKDTVDITRRMVPLIDPFSLMDLRVDESNAHLLWLGVHELLPVVGQLPASTLKQYCLRQCQTLIRQAMSL